MKIEINGKYWITGLFLMLSVISTAQYAPPAGEAGSTAIYADSNIFADWASSVTVIRGWVNIADTSLGKATFGSDFSAVGKADNDVVSLGDGGIATLQPVQPIFNGPGADFAVFENSFDGHYLELAFVEVSSDGTHFVRFPAHSLTDTSVQVQAFDTINTRKINNLAGKYQAAYGTPFDLEELIGMPNIDLNAITHIRIVDVVGSINPVFSTYDTAGNQVNDPWPTAFNSCGFDLDAVGIIHQHTGCAEQKKQSVVDIFPNPANGFINLISNKSTKIRTIELIDLQGNIILIESIEESQAGIEVQRLAEGFYMLRGRLSDGSYFYHKVLIKR